MRWILVTLVLALGAACTSNTTVTETVPPSPTYSPPAYTPTYSPPAADPVVAAPAKCVPRAAVKAELNTAGSELRISEATIRTYALQQTATHIRRAAAAYLKAAQLLKDYPTVAREERGAGQELILSANALASGQMTAATTFLRGALAHINASSAAMKSVHFVDC